MEKVKVLAPGAGDALEGLPLDSGASETLAGARGFDLGWTGADIGRGPAEAVIQPDDTSTKRSISDLFGLDAKLGRRSRDGNAIMINVLGVPTPAFRSFVPQVDHRYVHHPEVTRVVVMALEENLTLYLTGHTGTGKTSAITQCCALTNRPRVRVQHTAGMEEAHIVGQWVVTKGQTVFMPGPLPFAMTHGLVYLADEYDMAPPSIAAIYQAVMEHQGLYIREAPEELRIVEPHPNFRFCGTGNTGGAGDETGLYQGTQIGNAANFSRWEVTDFVTYHDVPTEVRIVMLQAGIPAAPAERLVELATAVRKAFASGKVANTIGPRELVNAARVGKLRGGDFRTGLKLAYTNRLGEVDRLAVDQMAQRVLG